MSPRKRQQPNAGRTQLKNVSLFQEENPENQSVVPAISLQQIVLPSNQPRRYFDPDKLEQLTRSVIEHGILEPLLVRALPDERYELVAGERRYRAALDAGLTEVPIVLKELTDSEARQLALVENLQREDLNPVEETEGILQLLALKLEIETTEVVSLLYQMQNATARKITDNVISNSKIESVNKVFTGLGKMNRESFTANRLPLLRLPEDILEALRSGQIEYTKAKAIARVKDEATRAELLDSARANSLSLSQIKERVNATKPVKEKEELRSRVDTTYKQLKKSKQLWQDPKKRKKLESLLSQLEKLIEPESSSISQTS